MSAAKDFVVTNVPGLLSRRVTKPDPADPSKWILDDGWYRSVLEKYATLFRFYVRNGLLRDSNLPEVEEVTLRMSDFSDLGQRFIRTGAVEKWLAAFDRPGSKKEVSDVTHLEKQLTKLARQARARG